jgi:translation initiation factor IF-3
VGWRADDGARCVRPASGGAGSEPRRIDREGTAINRFSDRRGARDLGPRLNYRIRVPEVRVVDAEGNQLGILETREALRLAQEQGLDLVEVAPNAQPPVCRILDYGRYKYEQAKKQRDAKKKAHQVDIKGIRMRYGTEAHDLQYRIENARRFLEEGNKVQVTLIFRGRELSHPEIAHAQIDRLTTALADIAVVERPPVMEGRRMTVLIAPK